MSSIGNNESRMSISYTPDSQLVKRIKSFVWRAGAVGVIASLNFLVENASGFGFAPWVVILIGLIGGEITKALNTKSNEVQY